MRIAKTIVFTEIDYEDLSPDLVKALIATEDIRFAEHSGIDAHGLFRAIVKRGIN